MDPIELELIADDVKVWHAELVADLARALENLPEQARAEAARAVAGRHPSDGLRTVRAIAASVDAALAPPPPPKPMSVKERLALGLKPAQEWHEILSRPRGRK